MLGDVVGGDLVELAQELEGPQAIPGATTRRAGSPPAASLKPVVPLRRNGDLALAKGGQGAGIGLGRVPRSEKLVEGRRELDGARDQNAWMREVGVLE